MEYNICTLNNGLRVIHLPSASHVVYCGYQIDAGTRDELPGEEGMAHFCEHVSFKGTKHRKAWHILNCLESVGGDLNAFTNKEDTVYYASVLKEHLPRAVDVLTDIVFRSIYPEKEISKEVEVICDEIESYNDSPSELIYDEFEDIIFKGHPLGHNILGSADQLRTYTGKSAARFTERLYTPGNMVFFVCGDIKFDRLVRLLEKTMQDIPARKPVKTGDVALPEYHPGLYEINHNTHQVHVMMGNRAYCATDDKRIPLYLLNNILGGPGMNAYFNLSLRERKGLVYTVESNMVCYRDTGLWSVYFGCDPHDADKCMRLVRQEMSKVSDNMFTSSQLNAAKKQIKGQIGVASDNRESFALDMGRVYLHFGEKKNLVQMYEEIEAVTAEQIQSVAAEVFDEDKLTTLIIK